MNLRASITIVLATLEWAFVCSAVAALPLQGSVHIVAPSRLSLAGASGKLNYQTGVLSLENLLASNSTATVSVYVDKNSGTASASIGAPAAFVDMSTWRSIPLGAIAANPGNLGALAFLGDRLPTEAKLLKRTTYQGHQVDLYFFHQDKDHFGEVFYSPLYGFPLKIDSYDASKDERTVILIENIH